MAKWHHHSTRATALCRLRSECKRKIPLTKILCGSKTTKRQLRKPPKYCHPRSKWDFKITHRNMTLTTLPNLWHHLKWIPTSKAVSNRTRVVTATWCNKAEKTTISIERRQQVSESDPTREDRPTRQPRLKHTRWICDPSRMVETFRTGTMTAAMNSTRPWTSKSLMSETAHSLFPMYTPAKFCHPQQVMRQE